MITLEMVALIAGVTVEAAEVEGMDRMTPAELGRHLRNRRKMDQATLRCRRAASGRWREWGERFNRRKHSKHFRQRAKWVSKWFDSMQSP